MTLPCTQTSKHYQMGMEHACDPYWGWGGVGRDKTSSPKLAWAICLQNQSRMTLPVSHPPPTPWCSGKKPDTGGHRVCDPTDRKCPGQANPETAIGLAVARAAGRPRKGSEQVSAQFSHFCKLITGGFKV